MVISQQQSLAHRKYSNNSQNTWKNCSSLYTYKSYYNGVTVCSLHTVTNFRYCPHPDITHACHTVHDYTLCLKKRHWCCTL